MNQTISAINRKAETMTTSTDGKLNKSIVVSKLYDQKIKSLENEVQKKVFFLQCVNFFVLILFSVCQHVMGPCEMLFAKN